MSVSDDVDPGVRRVLDGQLMEIDDEDTEDEADPDVVDVVDEDETTAWLSSATLRSASKLQDMPPVELPLPHEFAISKSIGNAGGMGLIGLRWLG